MMTLRVISPKSPVVEYAADKIFFPGVEGGFEVLRGHAAMVAALGKGKIRYEGPQNGEIEIESGFVKVENDIIQAIVE